MQRIGRIVIPGLVAGLCTAAATASISHVITFDNGWEGWQGVGTEIVASGGNPGAFGHTDHFGHTLDYWTTANESFLGDYTLYASVTLSIDVKVDEISTLMGPESRELFLELSNFSDAPNEWISVWMKLGELDGNGMGWTTFSVTFDPNNLSALWQGSDSGMVGLPDGFTFHDVLSNVEEARFTATEPGWEYTAHFFDVGIDNIRIEATLIPAPGAALALLGLIAARRSRRRA